MIHILLLLDRFRAKPVLSLVRLRNTKGVTEWTSGKYQKQLKTSIKETQFE
jgi:hypothetical protein